jgi:hypothetical protein
VEETVSHYALIREARREIRALKPGRGIRRDAWFFVRELLLEIAGYLPDCWPSERTLATKLGRKQQAVHRTLDKAREWGLVTTTVRPMEYGWRPAQTYHLVCLSEGLKAALSRQQIQTTDRVVSKSSSSKKTDTGSPSGIPRGQAAPGREGALVAGRKIRSDDPSGDFDGVPVTGAPDPYDTHVPIEPESPDPAIYLARRFDTRWGRMIRAHPELSDVRASSRGAVIGYLRDVMLPQVASPEHAEAYMDAFIHAAADGDIEFKDGQHAWQRFTGWWGKVPLEDPRIRAEQRAASQSMIEEYRRQTGA